MLYSILRPLLFRMDPEAAHDRALRVAAWLARRARTAAVVRTLLSRPGRLPLDRMGLHFEHRVGLAAGLDKNGVAPMAWWALGFSFVELGTVTPRPQAGHARPRMFRLPGQFALVNRMGFNNDGAEVVAARLADQRAAGLRPPIPIAISLGKNATTPIESAVDDYAEAARILAPQADILTMNISSPNTPDLRSLQTRALLAPLIRAIRVVAPNRPLLVKVAPELEGEALDDVVAACLECGAAGLIATNTLNASAFAGLPEGGVSGRPLRDIAPRRVEHIRRRMPEGVLVGCGGIDDAVSACQMLDAGADLVQMYTSLVYRGPFVAARISRSLGR